MLLQMALFCSFLWLNSSPLYVHVCVYIYIYVHHIFFIRSPADGHLGCFYDLAIVSSATVNMKVLVSFQIIYSFVWVYAQEWDCWII